MAGIVVGTLSAFWLIGTFKVSEKTAQAIVNAVDAGSWAMFLASIATTGGLIGVGLWGAIKLAIKKKTKALAAL